MRYNDNWMPAVIAWLAALLAGCSPVPSGGALEYALVIAGDRRDEFAEMIGRYDGDPEKKEAGEYLVAAMPYHGSRIGPGYDRYRNYFRLYSEKGDSILPYIDSLQNTSDGFDDMKLRMKLDIHQIDTAYIGRNIELAFETRRNTPWGRNLDFETFLRYVLPYRIKNEIPEAWRDSLEREWRPLRDSLAALPSMANPLVVAGIIADEWNKKEFHWTSKLPDGPGVGVATVRDKVGTCLEYAHGLIYLLRYFGIPAGVDMVTVRGTNNSKHFWPFTLDAGGNTWVACTEDPTFNPAPEFDIYASKIQRAEFAINPVYTPFVESGAELPPYFRVPLFSDVTSHYKPGKCYEIEVDISDSENKPVMLAMPRYQEWEPVDIAMVKNGKAVFKNVAGGVVGIAGNISKGRFVPLTDPFEIDSLTGKVRTITKDGGKQQVTLYSKFVLDMRNGDFVERLLGGRIEGANRRDFSDAVVLHTIREYPYRKCSEAITDPDAGPFRYIRYIGSDSTWCNISELALYGEMTDTIPLKGIPFGSPGDREGKGDHTCENVFDGSTLTSYDALNPSGDWSAIDLGRARHISRIVYTGRNRDNYINRGETYELFYFGKGQWHSLGRQKATADSLIVKNVPVGALLYLKNHSSGYQERIFEYLPGECPSQRWW